MNDTLSLLRVRRSVPPQAMTGAGPSPAELDDILTIAARVPDHGKLAPWRFLVIDGEARATLGEVVAGLFRADTPDADAQRVELERGRLSRAPLVVGVVSNVEPHPKIPEWEQVLSAGAVCMNLIVAANAAGYATAWLTEWYAYDRRFLDAIGLRPHERMAGFIHLGIAAERPADRVRPVLADIVTRV